MSALTAPRRGRDQRKLFGGFISHRWKGLRKTHTEIIPADRACPFLPGTPGKVDELIRRQELHMELWHPFDNTGDEDQDDSFWDI